MEAGRETKATGDRRSTVDKFQKYGARRTCVKYWGRCDHNMRSPRKIPAPNSTCLPQAMSADKRALDDLDALFRAFPAQSASSSRPVKKLRPALRAGAGAHSLGGNKGAAQFSNVRACAAAVSAAQRREEETRQRRGWLFNENPMNYCGSSLVRRGSRGEAHACVAEYVES